MGSGSQTTPSQAPVGQSGLVDPVSDRGTEPTRGGGGRLIGFLEAEALFVAVVALVAVVCLAAAAGQLAQDGYLALVDGRLIAEHGIPHHSYLTVMASGVKWVDQQWLAQLAFYELQKAGGYGLLVVIDVALATLALGWAIFAARDLGGSDRQMIRALPLGAILYVFVALNIRSQVFAYPLFVATLWLLATEVRRPGSRRVYLVFPMLILWANLHGSVTLGAAMAMLYGLTLLIGAGRMSGARAILHPKGLLFIIGPPLCVLATPYGFSIIHYYHSTLFNSGFGHLVTEWEPIYSEPVLAIFYVPLLAWTGWLLWRSRSRTPLFDWLVLILLAIAGIDAIRNVCWFGLATIVLLPAIMAQLGKHGERMPSRRKLDLSIAFSTLAVAVIAVLATFGHPSSWFQSSYGSRGITLVRSLVARDPSARIFADVRFADWLIWTDPSLAGHLAYDTSFELLPTTDLEAVAAFDEGHRKHYENALAPYSVVIGYPSNKSEAHAIPRLPGVTVHLRTKDIIVATRQAT